MKRLTPQRALALLLFLLAFALLISGFGPSVQGKGERTLSTPEAGQGARGDLAAAPPWPPPLVLAPRGGVGPAGVPPTPTHSAASQATAGPVYVPPLTDREPLVAADLCDETEGQVSVHTVYSSSLGRALRYRLYLPPCYAEAGRLLPVLYMFHGLNYGDSQWDTLGLDEWVDAGIAAGELPPMIVVMPNIWGIDRHPDGGPGSVEEALVADLLPHVEETYCAWNARTGRAIGGLSRGAFWALEIAFRHPDLFASVGGHSPAIFWDNAPPEYNPYYLAADAPDLESLRIYLDLGEEDWLNKWLPLFLERLDERGLTYTFDTAPGAHGYAYWRSQLADYLAFYTAGWPSDWARLPTPPDCTRQPEAPGCRHGLGSGRPCDVSLP